MRKTILLFAITTVTWGTISCTKEDNASENNTIWRGETIQVNDLNGSEGAVFFSLRENQILPKSDSATANWDIYFNGTTILLNGGSSGIGLGEGQVVPGLYNEAQTAPMSNWRTDEPGNPALSSANGNGWYIYNDGNATPPHSILMAPGRIIWVKTADGQVAKIELLSYYKGNPDTSAEDFANLATRPASRYYTFRYSIAVD